MTGPDTRLWHTVGRSLVRHPWRWTFALLLPLIIFPVIDITVSGWFYDPEARIFPARVDPFFEWWRKSMPYYLFAVVIYVIALWAAGEWLKDAVFGVTRRVAAYLVLSLALGPGLVVNVILKDSWGRPRPSTILEFGGPNYFVPPLVITDQCDSNCSFSSGHGALGFWPVAFALLAPPRWRPHAIAAALAFGAMVGFVRIAQGGHFLSDVAFSAVITVGIIWWLYRRMIRPGDAASPKNNAPEGGESP
ncbi:MAG: phosphatase PAP2 family protein [Pseudomonadota bacterium]